MKTKCTSCDKLVETSLMELGMPKLCDECISLIDQTAEDLETAPEEGGIQMLGEFSESDKEVIEKVLSELQDKNSDFDGTVIAIKGSNLLSEIGEKMHMLKARVVYKQACEATLAAIHSLKHGGMPDDLVKDLVEKHTKLEFEIVSEYLFADKDKFPTYEELFQNNLKVTMECDND